jgi:hypothetical protein
MARKPQKKEMVLGRFGPSIQDDGNTPAQAALTPQQERQAKRRGEPGYGPSQEEFLSEARIWAGRSYGGEFGLPWTVYDFGYPDHASGCFDPLFD